MTLPAHRYLSRAKGPAGDEGAHNFGFDIDGVLDAFPRQIGTIITSLTAAAHRVYIITGVDGDTVTQSDVDAKRGFLSSLGLGEDAYYQLAVIPEPHDVNKAKFIRDHDIGVLVDNSKPNIKAAAKECVALLLWNSREK